MTEKELSPLGKLYKRAEESVMDRYRTELDNKGRSQAWKAEAVKEDRISNRRSGVVDQFIIDVESAVDRLQKAIEEVKQQEEILEKLVGKIPQVKKTKHPQSLGPPYIPPDTSVHGYDGDWN